MNTAMSSISHVSHDIRAQFSLLGAAIHMTQLYSLFYTDGTSSLFSQGLRMWPADLPP